MTEKVLPQNLNYNTLKPVGYPSLIKSEKFTPVSFNTASMSDVIRFNINTNGFWDPYSAYIKIEVDTAGMDSMGVQQLDSSAHSFISQLIISNQGSELERIEEYDTLAAILVDMNYSPETRSSRKFEGISSVNGITNDQKHVNQQNTTNAAAFGNQITIGYTPNLQPDHQTIANQQLIGLANYNSTQGSIGFNTQGMQRYEQQLCNNTQTTVDSLNQATNYYINTIGTGAPAFDGICNTTDSVSKTIYTSGYCHPYNYSLSSGGNEEVLSPNYVFNSTVKGNLNKFQTKQKATFCIPLISGLLGILMPNQSYKYIPMKALQNLILEFRLNPYALFTSGYMDSTYITDVSTVNQIRRQWKITKFEINVEMQYFESAVENVILSQLQTDKGIVIHSSSWQLGPRYAIPANTNVNGIYQVNLGFESLRNVIWTFIPDDFLTYNYCRKQYRINHNISQFYLKIGTDYYPSLPITGHAGNPLTYGSAISTGLTLTKPALTNDSDFNNSEFLINLYKVFGRYADISIDAFIDPVNFAVNERVYDPAATGALYVSTVQTKINNPHTAGGNPLFHENRCIGKAVFGLNLETLNNDFSVISGINTINNRPFEINIKSDGTNTTAFTRPSTMYVFCQYDMLLQLKTSGVQVLGRG